MSLPKPGSPSCRAFDPGHETSRRQALAWHVLCSAIDRLEAEDPWFAMNREITAICPARLTSGSPRTHGPTRMLDLPHDQPDEDGHADAVLHGFMHLWIDDHSHGTTDRLGAACSLRGDDSVHLPTRGRKQSPNAAFHDGCANWASNALRHALWGTRRARPLNRRYLAQALGLTTLQAVERSEFAVDSALRLLSCDDNRGWWSHLLGSADACPDNRPDDNGSGTADFDDEVGIANLSGLAVPAGLNSLSPWDVLRTFRASPGDGWDTDWQLGNVDHGIARFIDRAVDIHHLGEHVRLMLKRSIDPLATSEPRNALPRKSP